MGGVLFTMAVGTLSPDTFGINLAIFLIVGLVVGGVATTWGPVIGGLVIIFVPHLTGQVRSINGYELTGDRPYGTLFLGLLLIAITFILPGGVVDGFRRLRSRFVRVVRTHRRSSVAAATGDGVRQITTPATLSLFPTLGEPPTMISSKRLLRLLAALLGLALVAAACNSDDDNTATTDDTRTATRPGRTAATAATPTSIDLGGDATST